MSDKDDIMKKIDETASLQLKVQEQRDKINELVTHRCGPECQERKRKLDQAMLDLDAAQKKPAEKPVHHILKPFDPDCPGCHKKNPYLMTPEDLNTEFRCTECQTPVLESWTECPNCGEALDD